MVFILFQAVCIFGPGKTAHTLADAVRDQLSVDKLDGEEGPPENCKRGGGRLGSVEADIV